MFRRPDQAPTPPGRPLADPWPAAAAVVDEARTVHQALCAVRDRWAQAGTGTERTPPATAADHINIEPTPAGHRAIAGIADREKARYARLADRIAPIIEAAELLDAPTGSPRPPEPVAGVVLVGISAEFTPIEIEGLVRTAAEVICDCQVCRMVRTLSGSL